MWSPFYLDLNVLNLIILPKRGNQFLAWLAKVCGHMIHTLINLGNYKVLFIYFYKSITSLILYWKFIQIYQIAEV